jgi:hypothetical protein
LLGSAHPKARHAASQEGSDKLIKLFKKGGFYSYFAAVMKDTGTIVPSSDGASARSLRNPQRQAALADTDLPDSDAEEAFDG